MGRDFLAWPSGWVAVLITKAENEGLGDGFFLLEEK